MFGTRALIDRWQDRFEAWLLRRVPSRPLPQRIGRRRVYIMPTPAGYAFAAMVFALWLGSMNYSNSMGFALAFLLAGIGLVAMHMTHANLLGVELRVCDAPPVHAGDTARLRIALGHAGGSARAAIAADWPRGTSGSGDRTDLPAHGSTSLRLSLDTERRGQLALPPISLSTRFPLGLFRAWTWIRPEVTLTVYPAPLATPLQPAPAQGSEGAHSDGRTGRDSFDTLRDYRRGDTRHDIHWKRLPKDGKPTVKQFFDTADRRLWLDWSAVGGDTEERLSRLCAQVVAADARGLSWGLRLPRQEIGIDTGSAQRHRCLRALALFGPEPGP